MRKNTLCVVSPDGELIHSLCFKTWGVREPFGIDVTCGGNLVVGFQAGKSAVVILLIDFRPAVIGLYSRFRFYVYT